MKRFMLVVIIVLVVIGILAACAPIQQDVESYARTLPGWAIIVGAVIIFLIGFGIIWKLIPGFIKVLAVIALAVILAGSAYGLWQSPWTDKANQLSHDAEELRDEYFEGQTSPTVSPD
jgi:predicted small secreted protein